MMASFLSAGQEVSLYQRNPGFLNHLEENVFLFASNTHEASSSLTDIAALVYLLHSVSNKYLELFGIIIYVSQYHLAVCPKGFILPFNV